MAISNMEKNIFLDISTNSHQFFKSTHLLPRVAFSQYVLRQFLNLYFVNINDLKAFETYFKILYFKNIINSLMMTSHYISLIEIEDQKQGIEKKYQNLLFQSKQETFVSSYVKEDISWIDEGLANINRKIDDSINDISKKLKLPKKTVEEKVEKLFERFQEILSVSIYAFQKSIKESHHDELDINQFKKQIDYHLKQHLHLNDSNFLYDYGLSIAGMILIIAAIGTLVYPNIILSIGANALVAEIILGLVGALLILFNQYFPDSKESYSSFLQI